MFVVHFHTKIDKYISAPLVKLESFIVFYHCDHLTLSGIICSLAFVLLNSHVSSESSPCIKIKKYLLRVETMNVLKSQTTVFNAQSHIIVYCIGQDQYLGNLKLEFNFLSANSCHQFISV